MQTRCRPELGEPIKTLTLGRRLQGFVSGGVLNISVDELSSLSVGDTLAADPPEKAEVKVNDFPLFSADIGISGSKVAVKLEKPFYEVRTR